MEPPSSLADFYRSHARSDGELSGKYQYDLMMPDDGQLRIYTLAAATRLNDELDIEERLPGFFAVGDDAGEEILCVEIQSGRVVSVPVGLMKPDEVMHVADSLAQIVADGVE